MSHTLPEHFGSSHRKMSWDIIGLDILLKGDIKYVCKTGPKVSRIYEVADSGRGLWQDQWENMYKGIQSGELKMKKLNLGE